MSVVHRFYCARCDRFMYGQTVTELATGANYHATSLHPADFANWTPLTIVASSHYAAPQSTTQPQYLVPHGVTSHRAPLVADITEADRQMLKAGHILWD
jgi:hypothetical protein